MANQSDSSKKPKCESHLHRLSIEGVGHATALCERTKTTSLIQIVLSDEKLLPEYEHPDMAAWYDTVVTGVPRDIPTEISVFGPGGKLISQHLLVPTGFE